MKVVLTTLAVFMISALIDPGPSHAQRRNLRDIILDDSSSTEFVGNSGQTVSDGSFSGRRRLRDIAGDFGNVEAAKSSARVIESGAPGGKRRLRDIVDNGRVD